MRLLLSLLAAIVFTAPAAAQHYRTPDDLDMFKKLEPVTVEPDKGYIFLRMGKTSKKWQPGFTLIRKLSDEEIAAYEIVKTAEFEKALEKNTRKREKRLAALAKAKDKGEPYTRAIPPILTYEKFVFEYDAVSNVYAVPVRKEYQKTEYGRDVLFTLTPGQYVLADIGGVCMCLGTVQFTVKPGVVTDMGMIVSDIADRYDEPSKYPEVWERVKDHGTYRTGFFYVSSALRPHKDEMSVPDVIKDLERVPADYTAMGKMPVYFSTMVDRLAPVPGVLDYKGDKVIDVKALKTLDGAP